MALALLNIFCFIDFSLLLSILLFPAIKVLVLGTAAGVGAWHVRGLGLILGALWAPKCLQE